MGICVVPPNKNFWCLTLKLEELTNNYEAKLHQYLFTIMSYLKFMLLY